MPSADQATSSGPSRRRGPHSSPSGSATALRPRPDRRRLPTPENFEPDSGTSSCRRPSAALDSGPSRLDFGRIRQESGTMRRHAILPGLALLLGAAASAAAQDGPPALDEASYKQWIDFIIPSAEENKWEKVG